MIRQWMDDIHSLLSRCEALTSGQTPVQIFDKAIRLLEDPIYWCGRHRACIRRFLKTPDGREYYWDEICKVNHPEATCVNIEGAVARACNNEGILPPFLMRYLDQTVLDYLRARNINLGLTNSVYNPYDVGWFCEQYGHVHALNFLHEIMQRLL